MNDNGVGSVERVECDVERVVVQLRAIEHKSAWDRILEIGRVVFEGISGGDESEWVSRRGRKDVSLRKLVEHQGCPFRRSALSNAVNVHLFVRAHQTVPAMVGITPSHVTVVTRLRSDWAMELLEHASTNGWSGRELGARVRVLRREAGERRGRPRSPAEWRAQVCARQALQSLNRMQTELGYSGGFAGASLHAIERLLDELEVMVTETRAMLLGARPKFPVKSGPITNAARLVSG